MTQTIARFANYTDDYIRSAQTCCTDWEKVRKDHNVAMLVRQIEDSIAIGERVVGVWIKRNEEWHAWVSGDSKRFDETLFAEIQETERNLLENCSLTITLIDQVKQLGYEVVGELEFRRAYSDLRKRSNLLLEPPQISENARDAFKKVLKDYRNGELEECANPWSAD